MGIAIPRPALRAKGNRTIEAQLRRHKALMDELMAQGMDKAEASRVAYEQMCKAPKGNA